VSNEQTTLLYILSTLAQTCAALAAFVGAIRSLPTSDRTRLARRGAESDLRGLLGRATGRESFSHPVDDVLAMLDEYDADPARHNDIMPRAQAARRHWNAFVPRLRWSRWVLIFFESWEPARHRDVPRRVQLRMGGRAVAMPWPPVGGDVHRSHHGGLGLGVDSGRREMTSRSDRRVCSLCGQPFAILIPERRRHP